MASVTIITGWMICAIITGCTHVREPYEASGTAVTQPVAETARQAASFPAPGTGKRTIQEQIIAGKKMIDSAVAQAHASQDAAPLLRTRMYFESLLEGSSEGSLIRYYIGYCGYHASLALREKNEEMAEELIEEAMATLEESLEDNRSFADGWALLSSCYGIKSSFGAFSGMKYGPKAGAAIKRAQELEPENPRVILIAGISRFYTPEAFGGDKEEALRLFKASAAIFDAQTKQETAQPSWGHEEAHTYIGITMMDKGDIAGARGAFEQVLKINPEFGWVKYVLLPELETQGKK